MRVPRGRLVGASERADPRQQQQQQGREQRDQRAACRREERLSPAGRKEGELLQRRGSERGEGEGRTERRGDCAASGALSFPLPALSLRAFTSLTSEREFRVALSHVSCRQSLGRGEGVRSWSEGCLLLLLSFIMNSLLLLLSFTMKSPGRGSRA